MASSPISDQVKKFISDHIASVAQLEILLLLQTNPAQAWTPADIARELRIEATGAQQQLTLLASSGLVREEPPGTFAYAPVSPDLHAAAVAVAQAYLVRRVTVIGLIFDKTPDKLRAFSDAFRLRKEPPP